MAQMREIARTRQVDGEPPRRWFFSHQMDLLVWLDEAGAPQYFQLCYGKYHDEHALRWKPGHGHTHYRVDDGAEAGFGGGTAFLIDDGPFDAGRVLDQFQALSVELPLDVVQFVTDKLQAHPNYNPAPVAE